MKIMNEKAFQMSEEVTTNASVVKTLGLYSKFHDIPHIV